MGTSIPARGDNFAVADEVALYIVVSTKLGVLCVLGWVGGIRFDDLSSNHVPTLSFVAAVEDFPTDLVWLRRISRGDVEAQFL